MLHPLIEEPAEINRQIFRKPLGYPGDYITMNYIYDYHGNHKYLGKSSYEKIINNYTCNIPFSISNIVRKDFFKKKILEAMDKKQNTKIVSVGSGSMRELLELLKEGRISKNIVFSCLDFEKKALNYIDEELKKIEDKKKEFLNIRYLHNNIIDIIRNKSLKEKLADEDLIYVSGVFDYLKDRFASRLIKELYELLNKKGTLIICNASAENFSHRAYYEMLGEWNMFHRTREELLSWTRDISDVAEIKFEQPEGFINYLFLSIKKL
jgi:SAM-dependent methyltransferase